MSDYVPVTDDMVETAARARWISKALDPRSGATREWCERAWDDMGGSEPSDERANEEICMRAALEAVAPQIAATAPADRPTVTDDARAEAARRWGDRRTSDRLPMDWLDEGMASGFVLGAQWAAARTETTTVTDDLKEDK